MDIAQGQEEIDVDEQTHKREEITVIGEFDKADRQASYITYLYTDSDELYNQIRGCGFGGHTTGTGGRVSSGWSGSPIVGQKNAFC